jgi:spore germination protein YaaH
MTAMRPRPPSRPATVGVLLLVPALLAGILSVDAAAPVATLAADPGIHARANRQPAPSHQVYGYLPYWQLDARTAGRLDYRQLSTIAFFAVPIGVNGALDRHAPGYRAYVSSAARAVTNAAHARGVRVVPTFQLFDPAKLRRILAHPRSQERFIEQALALMARRRADGANLDVEPVPASLAAKFAAFVGRFSHRMHRRFPGSQLAVATPAIVSDRLLRGLEPVVDRFFVMAYDYHWPGSRLPGAVAPLSDGPHNVAKTIRNYLRLVPRQKLILGVPYYGYSWPVVRAGGSWRVRRDPARWGGVRAVTYASALTWLSRHPAVKVHRDPEDGSWFRYVDRATGTVRQVHFEDSASAGAKFNFAIANGLAGVGIWSIGNDAGRRGMALAVQRTFVRPVRRVTARTTVAPVRLVRGEVRLDASIVLRDRGSRAERGTVSWRILDPRGRTIGAGRRLGVLYPGGDLTQPVVVTLGRASSLRAGIYRLVVRFAVGSWTPVASTIRFRQPY